MEKYFFKPFVGDNYQQGISGKKILVLGDSHYCESIDSSSEVCRACCRNHVNIKTCKGIHKEDNLSLETIGVMKEYLKKEYVQKCEHGYENFMRTFCNKDVMTLSERISFWNSVSFYNYCQYFLPSYNKSAHKHSKLVEDFEPFKSVLKELNPDIFFVWGKPVANILINTFGKDALALKKNIYRVKCDGVSYIMCCIHHPSSYYSWTDYIELVQDSLQYD